MTNVDLPRLLDKLKALHGFKTDLELAVFTGISTPHICGMRSGKRSASRDTLEHIRILIDSHDSNKVASISLERAFFGGLHETN